jgi:hypothetical protein
MSNLSSAKTAIKQPAKQKPDPAIQAFLEGQLVSALIFKQKNKAANVYGELVRIGARKDPYDYKKLRADLELSIAAERY